MLKSFFKKVVNFGVYYSHEWSRKPKRAYPGDAGYDLSAVEYTKIEPKSWAVVGTGIHFDIPDGWEIQIRSRSGLAAKKGVFVLNSPATIDSSYCGEIKIILMNMGEFPFEISPGDRVAQAVFSPVFEINLNDIDDLPQKERNNKGFGSSGISVGE